MIYFDQGATSFPKLPSVKQAVMDALDHNMNAQRSTGAFKTDRLLYSTRKLIAQYFNLPSFDHVIFNSGNTESLNTCLKGILSKDDHVITTYAEHNSVLRPLRQIGVDLTVTAPYKEDILKEIREDTKMIVMTHSSNVTGELYDIDAIGQIAHEHHILFVVDSAQSAGHISIDMQKSHIDLLTFSGHKALLGMSGVGGICVNTDIFIHPLKTGGTGIDSFNKKQPDSYPEHLEAGTLNIPGIASLNAGMTYLLEHQKEIEEKEKQLFDALYEGMKRINGISFYCDYDTCSHTPIIAFNLEDYDSSKISDVLSYKYHIITRCGAHCAPLMHTHLNTVERGIVRFSLSFMNSMEEVNTVIDVLREMTEE